MINQCFGQEDTCPDVRKTHGLPLPTWHKIILKQVFTFRNRARQAQEGCFINDREMLSGTALATPFAQN